MTKFKYVVGLFRDRHYVDVVVALVFPVGVNHDVAAKNFFRGYDKKRLLSAGFGRIGTDGTVSAYGRSESLGLESRPEDVEHLKITFGQQEQNDTAQYEIDLMALKKQIETSA